MRCVWRLRVAEGSGEDPWLGERLARCAIISAERNLTISVTRDQNGGYGTDARVHTVS